MCAGLAKQVKYLDLGIVSENTGLTLKPERVSMPSVLLDSDHHVIDNQQEGIATNNVHDDIKGQSTSS